MNIIGKNEYKIGKQIINPTSIFYRIYIRWFVPIRFVAFSVYGLFGLWPFRFVAVMTRNLTYGIKVWGTFFVFLDECK